VKNRVQRALADFLNASNSELSTTDASISWCLRFLAEQSRAGVLPAPSSSELIRVHNEIKSDVRDLLGGKRILEIESKINFHQPRTLIRFIKHEEKRAIRNSVVAELDHKVLAVDGAYHCVVQVTPIVTDFRRMVYGTLRRLLESGNLNRLCLCARAGCENFKFQATRKPRFCSDRCRWSVSNSSVDRKKKRRKGGRWY
jgi:hypothetical protein